MPKSPSLLILCSHSFRDPLFQGLMLAYLKQWRSQDKQAPYCHVLTEEQSDYRLSPQEQNQIQSELAQQGIFWYPQPYRGGSWIIFKKIWHLFSLLSLCWRIKRRENVQGIIGYMGIAGGYAYFASLLFRLPLGIMGFEPHSLNMRDFGIWSPKSLRFRLLSAVEKRQVQRAQALVAPTRHTAQLFKDWGSTAQIWTLGTSVDTQAFQVPETSRRKLRQDWHWENQEILLYVGKFGGIYYEAANLAKFFQALKQDFPQFRLLVISPQDSIQIQQSLEEQALSLDRDFKVLGRIPYEEISHYFAACDWGLIAVPPLASQAYRSPVKTGHYLSCGLPYWIPQGVSDDDELAQKQGVGLVLQALDYTPAFKQALENILQQNRAELRQHCKNIALQERGLHRSVQALQAMSQVLLKP